MVNAVAPGKQSAGGAPAEPMPNRDKAGSELPHVGTAVLEGVSGEARRLCTELFGTFALTFVSAGGTVIGAVSGGEVDYVARSLAPGLLVLAMIYALGAVSGAHINPAVTLAFAVRGVFPWWRVPGYLISQFLGGILAAAVLRALFGVVRDLGATLPRYGSGTALAMEVILTCFLVTVILNVATPYRLVGHNAALAVGCTVALCHLFAGPISGPSMNPARSLGPALVAGNLCDVWIYFIGPVAGGLLAVAGVWVLHGAPNKDEIKAANNP